MTTHIKVLGVLYIALSVFGLLIALFIALAFGTASGIVGMNADAEGAAIAVPIIGLAGTALVTFLVATALPGLIAGIGILKLRPWARILGVVVAVLHLIHIPVGTAVGIYALWVLLNKESEQVFTGTAAPRPI
jgi:hypothetical protein